MVFASKISNPNVPKIIDSNRVENIIAFAKSYGIIKYFYPNNFSKINWEYINLNGVCLAEQASNEVELIATLNQVFNSSYIHFSSDSSNDIPDYTGKSKLLYWRHVGFGLSDRSIIKNRLLYFLYKKFGPYHSKLVKSKSSENIDGGVYCYRISNKIYLSIRHSLSLKEFRKERGKFLNEYSKRLYYFCDNSNRSIKVAALIEAWNALLHFYPYQEYTSLKGEDMIRDAIIAINQDSSNEVLNYQLSRLSSNLNDGHATIYYLDSNKYFHPPFIVDWIENQAVITHVYNDSMLVSRGDIIAKIDGVLMDSVIHRYSNTVSSSTDDYKFKLIMYYMLVGSKNSSVLLDLYNGKTINSVLVKRTMIHKPKDVIQPIREVDKGICYLNLSNINQKTFDKSINLLKSCNSIILDFRGNSLIGSYMLRYFFKDSVMKSPYWLPPIISFPEKKIVEYDTSYWQIYPNVKKYLGHKNIIALANANSISGTETILSIIKHYKIGAIIGSRTAGANGNVVKIKLPNNSYLYFTGMRVLTQDMKDLYGNGITPDIEITPTINGVKLGLDELLEYAIQYAKRKAE